VSWGFAAHNTSVIAQTNPASFFLLFSPWLCGLACRLILDPSCTHGFGLLDVYSGVGRLTIASYAPEVPA